MYIDVKITTWERHFFHEELPPEKIAELIEDISNAESFDEIDLYTKNSLFCVYGDQTFEQLMEFSEYMTVTENEENATIEMYNDSGELIASNERLEQ